MALAVYCLFLQIRAYLGMSKRPASATAVKHFSVIQSMVRVGLKTGGSEFRSQVERLRDRLSRDGASTEVAALERLLTDARQTHDLEPTRVQAVTALFGNEVMHESLQPPLDKETGSPLCDIDLAPWRGGEKPFHDATTQALIEDISAEWRAPEVLRRLDVDVSRTCLIYGPPGSGKTMTARYLAGLLRMPLVTARIDGLVSSFLGTSSRNIANLFNFANRYNCVLLLDEFDALAKVRDDPQEIGEIKRVVNSLLQNLDARANKGVTIAITNHSQLLDPAVWRRFEAHVHLPAPTPAGRSALLTRFLAPVPVDPALLKIAVCLTDGWTGAQLLSLAKGVKRRLAVRDQALTAANVFEALRIVLAREAAAVENSAYKALAESVEAFMIYAREKEGLRLTQAEWANFTGVHQTTMSRRARSALKQTLAHAE